jgi:hypothetical protein
MPTTKSPTEAPWARNLRTSINAGRMSERRTVPINVGDIDLALDELARLRFALEESVKLQAHYAKLLNMHDGGERMVFPTVEAWIARLDEVRR